MDYLTQQFIAFANKALKQLQQIGDSISVHLQKQTEAINKANEAKDKSEHTTPVLRAELQIPESIIDSKKTEDTKAYRLQKWNFAVAVLTAVLLAIYTTLMYFQESDLNETIGQNQILARQARTQSVASQRSAAAAINGIDNSKKQFQQDQRPGDRPGGTVETQSTTVLSLEEGTSLR